jgi:putative ABC transport system permease protein
MEERRWRRYVRFWGSDPEADVDDELSFHLEERVRLNRLRGLAEDQARAEAERRFGDVARIRETCVRESQPAARSVQRWELLGDVVRDARIGVRSLVRSPTYTVTAVLALGLAIGASTAVFSVVNTVLLRPLPYAEPERVVTVYNSWEGADRGSLSPAEYLDFTARARAFSALGVYAVTSANVVEGDVAERVPAVLATASTFAALGVAPRLGRFFEEAPAADGAPAVVLSYEYWQSRFGGTMDIVGRGVLVNGTVRTVIGVLPPGVRLPGTYAHAEPPVLFTQLRIDPAVNQPRGSHFLRSVARLAPGWTVEAADAELKAVAAALVAAYPEDYPARMRFSTMAVRVHEDVVGTTRRLLLMLSAAVGLVLLVACANVSSLVLTRAEDRRRELAVRTALGAGRWRIARQLLTEHLILGLVAAGLGIAVAAAGVRAVLLLQPGDIPRLGEAGMDARVLAFTLTVSLLATLLVAIAPIRVGAGAQQGLREGGRTTSSRASQRVRRGLIAAEVALSIVLLTGAGLLLRSFANLIAVAPGYRTEQLLTVPISLPFSSYGTDAAIRRFYAELVHRAGTLPGVNSAGAVINLPLASSVGDLNIELAGGVPAAGDVSPRLDWQVVTPGWFEAMGIDIVRGRSITAADDERATGAVVLSESAAQKYWAGEDPIGRRFRLGAGAGPGDVTIVGIARDVRHGTLVDEPQPIMYLPHAQFTFWGGGPAVMTMTLVLHTAGEPLALLPPLRDLVRGMDPHVPLGTARTMEQVVGTAVAEPRFALSVIGSFALTAAVMALIGIYGLVAYTVARRNREIAVRMALGAQPRGVVRQVVLQGMRPVLLGVVIGALAAVAFGRTLQHLLYDVAAHDPLTLLATMFLLPLAAFVACVLPGRRAAAIPPLEALREE